MAGLRNRNTIFLTRSVLLSSLMHAWTQGWLRPEITRAIILGSCYILSSAPSKSSSIRLRSFSSCACSTMKKNAYESITSSTTVQSSGRLSSIRWKNSNGKTLLKLSSTSSRSIDWRLWRVHSASSMTACSCTSCFPQLFGAVSSWSLIEWDGVMVIGDGICNWLSSQS